MSEKVGDAFVELDLKDRAYNTKMGTANKKLAGFGKTLGKVAAVAAAAVGTKMLIDGLQKTVDVSSDAEETFSKFNVVFSEVRDSAEETARSLQKNFGLSSVSAKELLSNTGDLLSGFGFTQEKALDLSKQVNELSVDLASFKNVQGGATAASAAITKALLGERESLKSMGIAILEADVKTKMLQQAQQGQTFATERQAKAAATFALIVERSQNAIGDFARTQDSLANRQRLLAERFIDFQRVVGDAFRQLSGASGIVGGITSIIEKLTEKIEKLTKGGFFIIWSERIKAAAKIIIRVLTPVLKIIAGIAKMLGKVAMGIADMIAATLKGSGFFDDIFAEMDENIKRRMAALGADGGGGVTAGAGGAAAGGAVPAKRPAASFVGFQEAIRRATEIANKKDEKTKLDKKRNKALESIASSSAKTAQVLANMPTPVTIGA